MLNYKEKSSVIMAIDCRIDTLQCFVNNDSNKGTTVGQENLYRSAQEELKNLKEARKKLNKV